MNPAHLDYEALADLAEGLLDDDEAASANAHLDDCALCRERSAEIADVSRLLADVSVPPMPEELIERIDEAIRAEAEKSAPVASLPHRALKRQRAGGWRSRFTPLRLVSAAAAAVVVLGGGAVLGGVLLNGSLSGDDHASHVPADSSRGKAAVLAEGSFTVRRSGTVYRSATLAQQADEMVLKANSLPVLEDSPGRLVGCVDQVALGIKPVLVDAARFEGREATVIVVPTEGSTWRVVVVGPKCTDTTSDVIEETTIPAHRTTP